MCDVRGWMWVCDPSFDLFPCSLAWRYRLVWPEFWPSCVMLWVRCDPNFDLVDNTQVVGPSCYRLYRQVVDYLRPVKYHDNQVKTL